MNYVSIIKRDGKTMKLRDHPRFDRLNQLYSINDPELMDWIFDRNMLIHLFASCESASELKRELKKIKNSFIVMSLRELEEWEPDSDEDQKEEELHGSS